MVAEEDHTECEEQNPARELEQQAEDEDQVCDLAKNSSETVEDVPIEDMDIIGESLEDFPNWCDVEEEIDWGIHHLCE